MATISVIIYSEPEDFKVEDGFLTDDITFSKVGKEVTATASIYANTQNKVYDPIIIVTALRTGNFKLENAYRTSNNITGCAIRFYDLQHGTAGYYWVDIGTVPMIIELGTFNKDQIFILQIRISTGINTNSDEQIKFDMNIEPTEFSVLLESIPVNAEVTVDGVTF